MLFKSKMTKDYPRPYPHMQSPSAEPSAYQQAQIDRAFGMFIHFGINTFNNTEWSDGKLPAASYNPSAIDADDWVKTARDANMKYVILITKHHDGFCLWDTDTTDYCVNKSPNKTDVVGAVADACKKYGVGLGLYYSLWDRHEKCYKSSEKYTEYMEKQLSQLLGGKYGDIVELWLDGGWDKPCTEWQLDRIYNLVKTLQPACQMGVNLTIGKFNNKKGVPKKRYFPENQRQGDPMHMFPSDFRLFDPHMCAANDPKLFEFKNELYYLPFEQTICIRKSGHWFYSDEYESSETIDPDETAENYRILRKNNNLMVINMPPDKNGRLVAGDKKALIEIAEKIALPPNGAER